MADEQVTWQNAYNATVENTRRAEANLRECRAENERLRNAIRELEEEVRTWTARLWTLCCAIFEKHPGRIEDLAHRNAANLRNHFRESSDG